MELEVETFYGIPYPTPNVGGTAQMDCLTTTVCFTEALTVAAQGRAQWDLPGFCPRWELPPDFFNRKFTLARQRYHYRLVTNRTEGIMGK